MQRVQGLEKRSSVISFLKNALLSVFSGIEKLAII